MKVSALVLALALGATDAFIITPRSSPTKASRSSPLQSSPQPSPFNGGTAGSSNLPGQYGTINVDSPYGGQTASRYQPTGNKPTNEYPREHNNIGGPLNGGTHGSSNLPGQYDTVSIDDPYGGPRKNPLPSKPAVTDFSGGTNAGIRGGPINGGTNGSSLLPERYETVSIDHPWGGKNPQAPMEYYSPKSTSSTAPPAPASGNQRSVSLAARSGSNFSSGVTGGAEGSSRMVDRGVVGIDTPWGTNQRGA